MWMMIFIGSVLAAGFVLALRSQVNAYKLGQAEEELKTALDDYASQQKYLMLDQHRALSARASDRAGKEAGLSQLKLDQPNALRLASAQKVSMTTAPKAPAQKTATAATRKASAPKASVKAAQKTSPRKAPVARKVSTPLKSAKTDRRAAPAKAKKESDNQRQTASRAQRKR